MTRMGQSKPTVRERRWTDAQIHAARGLVYIAEREGKSVEPVVKEIAELPTKFEKLVS